MNKWAAEEREGEGLTERPGGTGIYFKSEKETENIFSVHLIDDIYLKLIGCAANRMARIAIVRTLAVKT